MSFTTIEEAIEFLQHHLQIRTPTAQFPNAAAYIGKSKDERALPVLLTALEHGSVFMRATAAIGLGELGDERAALPLMTAFEHDVDKYVRGDAALALGALAYEDAIVLLAVRFPQETFDVQKRIIWALKKIGTGEAERALQDIHRSLDELDIQPEAKDFLCFLISKPS